MACTIEEFRCRFPEFSDDVEYPNLRIQLFLDDTVVLHIGSEESRWCGKYNQAHCYLAAHLLSRATGSEMGDSGSKAGTVISKSAGGVSVTRSSSPKNRSDYDEFLMTTTYGQQFLLIRNSCFAGVLVAVC